MASAVTADAASHADDPVIASRPNALAATRESVTWLMQRQDLQPILFVMTLINLGFNTATTAIIYTLQQRGESPAVIGLLGSAIGAATLLGALIATPLVTRVRSGATALTSLALSNAAMDVRDRRRMLRRHACAGALHARAARTACRGRVAGACPRVRGGRGGRARCGVICGIRIFIPCTRLDSDTV